MLLQCVFYLENISFSHSLRVVELTTFSFIFKNVLFICVWTTHRVPRGTSGSVFGDGSQQCCGWGSHVVPRIEPRPPACKACISNPLSHLLLTTCSTNIILLENLLIFLLFLRIFSLGRGFCIESSLLSALEICFFERNFHVILIHKIHNYTFRHISINIYLSIYIYYKNRNYMICKYNIDYTI